MDGRGALPPSLAAALALRIERLGDDAQEVVRVLSAGGQLDDAVLAEVAGLDRRALRDGLREAVASHIVVLDGDRYMLRHALLREAVYDDLLPGERAELHRALARALEAQDLRTAQRAAAIAHHYFAANDQPAALAAAVRAGCAAMEVQAYREGATLFERALELWDRVPDAAELTGTDEAQLLERAASCHYYGDDLARAVTLTKRALALVDEAADPRRAAWLHGQLQRSLWALLRADEADAALERGLALLADDGPSPERAGLLARQARVLMVQSRYHRAVSVARRAMAEQAGLTEQGAAHLDYAGALNALGVSLVANGEIEEGVATLRRALDDAIARGDLHEIAPAAANLSEALHRVGRTTEALEVVRRRLRPARRRCPRARSGSRSPSRSTRSRRATGRPPSGRSRGWTRRRFSSGNSELNSCLRHAELALGRDERETARRHLARGAELAVDSREPQYLGVLGALEAELATREGDAAAARAAVELALDRIEFCSDDALRMAIASGAGLTSEASAAQHARDLGDERAVADALVHAELLVARVRACAEDGGPLEEAYLKHAEADYCRALGTDEVERWAEAAAAWDAMGWPYPAAIARWRQAEALVAAGDREAAVEPACAAIAEAERLGAAWLSGELESLAARARLRLTDAAGADEAGGEEDEDPFGLTPRERQVLALVAAGATNREIGKQLYMAEKTASVHVSRILAKLDVRSRTEAAGVAHRLGLDAWSEVCGAATPRRRAPPAPPAARSRPRASPPRRSAARARRPRGPRPGRPPAPPTARPPARGPARTRSSRRAGAGSSRPLNTCRSPRAVSSVWCRIAIAALVEPREVEVALVLVERLAGHGRRAGERDLEAAARRAPRRRRAPPSRRPSRRRAPARRRRPGWRSRSRRRAGRGPTRSRTNGRSRRGRRRGRPVRRVRPRAGREHDDVRVGRASAATSCPAAARRRAAPARAPRSRASGARARRARARGRRAAAARRCPPPRSSSTTSSPCSAASSAAATPAGPAPTTSDAQPPVRPRAARQRPLAARPRVDDAGDREPGVVVADAALVAADAGEHLAGRAPRGLAHQLGIGDQRARHPDRVGARRRDEPLGGGDVDHARRADHRHVDGRAARARAARRSPPPRAGGGGAIQLDGGT